MELENALVAKVEALRRTDLEHKEKISHLEKANPDVAGELVSSKEQYRQVAEVAAPVVDALAPEGTPTSEETLATRLRQSADELWAYVHVMAGTCATHVLSLVKALYSKQDMKPFVDERIEGVADKEYAALEDLVKETTEAILERMDF